MFGLFKKKSEVEILSAQYKKLMEESYKLSHSNRKASDFKRAEAEAIMDKIENLKKGQQS
ncbi:MAG: Lacal_2735 family protein [Cyclobacteriaceae bacterium]|nr:Lacal_2735 family protein [Cyclobacteriaceae bacterium]